MAKGANARQALVDTLAVELEALVLSGELPSGTRLRQEALALRFGVSRTPVREALRKLQAFAEAHKEGQFEFNPAAAAAAAQAGRGAA